MLINLLQYLSSVFFFFLHVQSSSSFPKALSPAEEHRCLTAMANGDRTARQKLIEHNLRLVAHIAKKYYADENDRDDLVSIGTIGLIKAVDSFKPDKGIRLSSYASRCIENATLSPPTLTRSKTLLWEQKDQNGVFLTEFHRKCTYFLLFMIRVLSICRYTY